LHIVRGEYPVAPGRIIGHEPVGVIEELGPGLTGYAAGDRVLVGAITPCGQCNSCLSGHLSQCGHGSGHEALGGWRLGNTMQGSQAEYLLVPSAQANLAKTLSSLGVYSGQLGIPYDAFNAGLGDHRIVTTLCPGGKERMRRLMSMVQAGRLDLTPLLTHSYSLDNIQEAYALFGERRDGVIKVAIRPS
jgi:threonine dehydrogenase-like Zn-dependent dehydrogenase